VNLKKVEHHLAELSLNTIEIDQKKIYHSAMLSVSEVIQDLKKSVAEVKEIG